MAEFLPFNSYTTIPSPQLKKPKPSYADVLGAQLSETFGPIVEGYTGFYAYPQGFDEDAADRVEAILEEDLFNFSDDEKRRLRIFGTSHEEINAQLQIIDQHRMRRETIANASGPVAFFSDPILMIDIMLMASAVGAPYAFGRTAGRFGLKGAAQGLEQTRRRVVTGEGFREPAQAAKVGAFYGAMPEAIVGAIGTADAAARMEDVGTEAGRAFMNTALFAGLGAGVGFSLAKVLGVKNVADAPIEDLKPYLTPDEIAQLKLKRDIKQADQRRKSPKLDPLAKQKERNEKAKTAAARRNFELSKNFKKYVDDVSGDEIVDDATPVGFKNEKLLKYITGIVPTPFRNIMFSDLPDFFKEATFKLASDQGLVTKANQLGIASEASVHLKKALKSKEWSKALTKIDEQYQIVNPRRTQQFMGTQQFDIVEKVRRIIGKESYTLGDWYELVGKTALRNTPLEQIDSEPLRNAVLAYREFMDPFTKELQELGLINSREIFVEKLLKTAGKKGELITVSRKIIQANQRWMDKEISKIQTRARGTLAGFDLERVKYLEDLKKSIDEAESFDDLLALRPKLDLTPRMSEALKSIRNALDDLSEQIDSYKAYIDAIDAAPERAAFVHFPRVYNRIAILKDRVRFENILAKWFTDNPTITVFNEEKLLFQKTTLPNDPVSVAERARRTTDTILGETDEDDIEMMFTGLGRGGPLASRNLNIPNELIEDFIVTDIKDIMIAYADRVGGRIEFHKAFKNPQTGKAQALEDILDQFRIALRREKVSEKDIDKGIKNFVLLYDSIVGAQIKTPDALDNKVAEVLRSVTNMTFLGRAGQAAIADASTIFMDNDLATIGKTFLGLLDGDQPFGKTAKELRKMGDLVEIERGMSHVRYMEGLSSSPFVKSTWDKMNHAFYNLNGLNYVTMITKNFEAIARGHTLIERSQKLVDGTATKYEREFLARNFIDIGKASKIVRMPYEKTKNELILPNTSQWPDEEIKELFQTAVRAGLANRIIMATPADRPSIMNGVLVFRKETAEKFGLPIIEDPRMKGYVRYESGLMTLPFAFYSYTFGALTKITGNYAQGAVNNHVAHIAASLILGGMIVKFRTPTWAWEEMDPEDKVARAFDFSGLAALYSDLTYRSLAFAAETGFDVEGFPLEPKFKADPDPYGAALSLFGAPADYSYNVGKSVNELLNGETSEGVNGIINSIPFISALAFMGVIKDGLKSVAQ